MSGNSLVLPESFDASETHAVKIELPNGEIVYMWSGVGGDRLILCAETGRRLRVGSENRHVVVMVAKDEE